MVDLLMGIGSGWQGDFHI